jgi:hypothetical protein
MWFQKPPNTVRSQRPNAMRCSSSLVGLQIQVIQAVTLPQQRRMGVNVFRKNVR